MAVWQNALTIMVRTLINDLGETPTFSDAKIQQAITVAGLISSEEFAFDTSYTFDLENVDISPDPAATATFDAAAVALFTLKAACMLDINRYQNAIATGIKVRDGDSEIDTTGGFKGYSDVINLGPCKSYDKLLRHKSLLKSMNLGKAVMSPITHEDATFWGTSSVPRFFDLIGGW